MTLSPIILFVYNRPKHTAETVEALKKNELASESVLYVFADGIKKDASEEQIEQIREVRNNICIVTHSGVNLEVYTNTSKSPINIKYIPSHYFSSIDSYSELLRNHFFYSSFKKYKYILIYQLDAWVYKDELKKWCNKGYDYIGAPWFENVLMRMEMNYGVLAMAVCL